jgi:hypothetical protein
MNECMDASTSVSSNIHEGKHRMANKEFVDEWGKYP